MYKNQKGLAPIIIALIVLVLAGVGGISYYLINKQLPKQIACTEEAKLCSDGSSVGRTGPNCEFTVCPEVKADETANWKTYTNNKYDYQINYPEDIYTIENITSNPEKGMTDDNVTLYDIKSVQKTKECECGEYTAIYINAYSNTHELSLENYIKENIKHWASDYSSLFINEQTSLNGIHAIKIGTEREQYYVLEKNNTIFSIGGFIDMNIINTFKFINTLQNQEGTIKIEKNGLTCYDSSKYFIVSKDGSNNLVKYKKTANQSIDCEYVIEDSDFKFGSGAEYFMALTGDYLITDSGTGPGLRGLGVYNLISRKLVYSSYHDGEIKTENNSVSYWTEKKEKVTKANCPDLDNYTSQGLGAVIESYVTLNLTTLTIKESGNYRCQATQ